MSRPLWRARARTASGSVSLLTALLVVVVIVAVVVVAHPAAAALGAEPTIAVVPFAPLTGDVPERAGEHVAVLLADSLRGLQAFQVVPLSVEPDEATTKALNDARELLAEARRQRDARRFGAPVSVMRRAVELLERAAARLEGPEGLLELSDAHVDLAIALFMDGQDDAGLSELRNALALTPGRTLEGEQDSLLFEAMVDRVRDTMRAEKPGSLVFNSTPPGAPVLLDATEVGRTPLTVDNVAPGQHLWRIPLSASDAVGGVVAVSPSQSKPVGAGLTGAPTPAAGLDAALATNVLNEAAVAAAAKVAASTGADLVAFGALSLRDSSELTMATFIYAPARRAVFRLSPKRFDAELIAAAQPMLDLAAELAGRAASLAAAVPEQLPAALLADAPSPRAFPMSTCALRTAPTRRDAAAAATDASKRTVYGGADTKLVLRDRTKEVDNSENRAPIAGTTSRRLNDRSRGTAQGSAPTGVLTSGGFEGDGEATCGSSSRR